MLSAFVAGALAGADRTAFGQTLLAHPLVAAALAGWWVGDPLAGLWLGIVLHFWSCPQVPVGESRLRDWTSVAVALPFALGPAAPAEHWGLGLLFGSVSGFSGGVAVEAVRRVAGRAVERIRPRILTGDLRGVERLHLGLGALEALRGGVVVLVTVALLQALVESVAPRLAPPERAALAVAWRLAPLAGLPLVFRFHADLGGRRWVGLGCCLGALVLWGVRG